MKLTSLALLALAMVASTAVSASALDALLAETSPKKEPAKPSSATNGQAGALAPTNDVGQAGALAPTNDDGQAGALAPTNDDGQAGALAPTNDDGQAGALAPTNDVGVAGTPVTEPSVVEPASETTNEVSQVEEPLPKKEKKKLTGRPAKITSDTTIYNRKEGIASFEGHVYVDDEQYQMHADKVFLFLEGTNELRRVVAIGHVAMTNETRRAYGAKATYSKKNGLVVLHSGDGITAEVRDESKGEEKIVRGKRIRFWIGAEQVEVDEADLTGTAPASGADSLKKALGK